LPGTPWGSLNAERLLAVAPLFAGAACALCACDSILGLNNFCSSDCTPILQGTPEAGQPEAAEASPDVLFGDSFEAGDGGNGESGESGEAGDGESGSPPEGGGDDSSLPPEATAPPPLVRRWARWAMPNPDAAIFPGADVMLPNPMEYDANTEAGTPVYDVKTGLTWEQGQGAPATSFLEATSHCLSLAGGWRVPTRIELVSLIDFTRVPLIDPGAFVGPDGAPPGGTYWSSSVVPADSGSDAAGHRWVVLFDNGQVLLDNEKGVVASWVRCVQGGSP
jgi:hypothetical protein